MVSDSERLDWIESQIDSLCIDYFYDKTGVAGVELEWHWNTEYPLLAKGSDLRSAIDKAMEIDDGK